MSSKGWINLESATSLIPDNQMFEGDSAFGSLFSLSRTQRLYGFVACLVLSFVLSLLGSILLFVGLLGAFISLYAPGIVISLIGTGFLIGFAKQLKLMFKPVRIVASLVFIISIILVFVGAYALHSDVLCIVFVIIEYLAYTWYSLSYIPYARAAALKLIGFA